MLVADSTTVWKMGKKNKYAVSKYRMLVQCCMLIPLTLVRRNTVKILEGENFHTV